MRESHHVDPEVGVEDAEGEEAGWDSLGEVLSGFQPEQVPSLMAARELEIAFPLLHALTHGNLRAFLVRVAVLEALVSDGRSPLKPADVHEVLYWLKEPVRETTIRRLRQQGWLTYESDTGYRITDHGRFAATVLSFLRGHVREGSLLPAAEGIDFMLRLGVDPVRQVVLLRAQLEDLRSQMEHAIGSHSEIVLRGATSRLEQGLALSERIRAILNRVPLELIETRRIAHDVHELLSRLHGVGSDLHAAITEVGRQYLRLVGGLTTTDIVVALMQLPVGELTAAGFEALRPIVVPPTLLVPEVLAAEAEAYLVREREAPAEVSWTDPPPPDHALASADTPAEVTALLDDLDRLVEAGGVTPLAALLPRGTAIESMLRASLTPLIGTEVGGEGVAGRLGATPLRVEIEEGPLVAAPPLAELSPGQIRSLEVDDG